VRPLTREWFGVLNQEFGEIDRYFTHEPIANYPEMALGRLKPR